MRMTQEYRRNHVLIPALLSEPVRAGGTACSGTLGLRTLSKTSCVPSSDTATSVTALKSGNTSTVSFAPSWLTLGYSPLWIDTRVRRARSARVSNTPGAGVAVSAGLGGFCSPLASPGAETALGAETVLERYAASVPSASVTSRAQS